MPCVLLIFLHFFLLAEQDTHSGELLGISRSPSRCSARRAWLAAGSGERGHRPGRLPPLPARARDGRVMGMEEHSRTAMGGGSPPPRIGTPCSPPPSLDLSLSLPHAISVLDEGLDEIRIIHVTNGAHPRYSLLLISLNFS
jgi:hypothetical protein